MAYYQKNPEIGVYETKLNNLDSDFKAIQECQMVLAKSSVTFKDILKQCDDIKEKFDRGTIEGKYDSYQITFNNKNMIFEFLDNIVSAANTFSTYCEDIKSEIDTFATKLDDVRVDISKEAQEVADTIRSLKMQSYFSESEPPRA